MRMFDALDERFPYFFILINSSLELDYVSGGVDRLIGFTSDELLGRRVDQLLHEDDLTTAIPMALEMMATGTESLDNPSAAHTVEIPIRVRTKGGDYLAMALSGRVLDDSQSIFCVLRPSAERYALDNVLVKLSDGAGLVPLLEAVIDLLLSQFTVPAGWICTAENGAVATRGNSSAHVLNPESILGELDETIRVVSSPDGGEFWVVPIIAGVSRTIYGALVLPSARPGGPSPYDFHVLRRTADLASLAFARSRFDQMLQLAANTDHLTGTLNRRAVERHISGLTDEAKLPSAVLFADLDSFKEINDRWGHAVGDDVLKTVSARIGASLRPGDVLGRLGGDEFVAVCSSLSADAVQGIRERIEASVSQPMQIRDITLSLSVSIGIAIANRVEDLADVLHRSDSDMYERKSGRAARR